MDQKLSKHPVIIVDPVDPFRVGTYAACFLGGAAGPFQSLSSAAVQNALGWQASVFYACLAVGGALGLLSVFLRTERRFRVEQVGLVLIVLELLVYVLSVVFLGRAILSPGTLLCACLAAAGMMRFLSISGVIGGLR